MSEETDEQIIKRLWRQNKGKMFQNGHPSWFLVDHPKLTTPIRFDDAIKSESIRKYEFRRGLEYDQEMKMKRYYVECEGVRVAERVEPIK